MPIFRCSNSIDQARDFFKTDYENIIIRFEIIVNLKRLYGGKICQKTEKK